MVTIMAMRLSPYVLLRPGELRQAEWTDVDFDDAIWLPQAGGSVAMSNAAFAIVSPLTISSTSWRPG